jgi:hypothetical protein
LVPGCRCKKESLKLKVYPPSAAPEATRAQRLWDTDSAVVAFGHYPVFVALAYSAVVRLRRPGYGGVGWRSRLTRILRIFANKRIEIEGAKPESRFLWVDLRGGII